jgi:hypothetical protein
MGGEQGVRVFSCYPLELGKYQANPSIRRSGGLCHFHIRGENAQEHNLQGERREGTLLCLQDLDGEEHTLEGGP